MSKRDRDRAEKQRQWEKEKTEIEKSWKAARQLKAALRSKGCILPFYDTLDSWEAEFKKLVTWAKSEFSSLHEVFEATAEELDVEGNWTRLGLPADWTQVRYDCDDDLAASYTARDSKANLRGGAIGFHDADGGFHTIIRVLKNPVCKWEHKEYKYAFKLPVLLHEIGHVKDFESKINFDRDSKAADFIEGEVYANLFALEECYRRAYFMSGDTWLDSLAAYKDSEDYRGEVARRMLARFQKPAHRPWMEYDLT
jgi:hypothetical protein